MSKNAFRNIKNILIYTYLSLAAISLFLIAFALSYSAVKFYDENNYPPVSLSSLNDLRRTIQKYVPKPFVVYSGSMEPAIKTASLIFTLPLDNYKKGDIITFSKDAGKSTITHRIEAITYENGINNPTYVTSGDANEDIDQGNIENENIIGKVFLKIAYVGHVVDFAKKPQGFILLVIVPATIIIYEELKSLSSQIKNAFKKKSGKSDEEITETSKMKSSKKLPRLVIAVPFVGVFFVFLGLTVSYFYDKEESIGNIMKAGVYGEQLSPTPSDTPPSPTPTEGPMQIKEGDVMINEFMPNPSGEDPGTEWIELYNTTSEALDLTGWTLEDTVGTINTFNLDGKSISANSFLVIEHSESSIILNNSGDGLELEYFDSLIDSVSYSSDPGTDKSIGRDPDGDSTIIECSTSTKGLSNNGLCLP